MNFATIYRSVFSAMGAALVSTAPVHAQDEQPANPEPGDRAPSIELSALLQAPDGAGTDWEALEGKVVVLEFWASWCGGCIAAVPHWNEIVEELAEEDFVFLGISNESREVVDRCIAGVPRRGWVGVDASDKTFMAYRPGGIPHVVVVDRSGIIRAITRADALNVDDLRAIARGEPHALPRKLPIVRKPLTGIDEAPPTERKVEIVPTTTNGNRMIFNEGVFVSEGLPLRIVLTRVYGLPKSRIEFDLPGIEERVDVTVHAPGVERGQMEEYARAALTRELDLVAREVQVEQDVCVLSRVEGSESLAPSTAEAPGLSIRGYHLNATKKPISLLLDHLSRVTGGTTFLDETELDGLYDFEVQFFDAASMKSELAKLGLEYSKTRREVTVTRLEGPEARARAKKD